MRNGFEDVRAAIVWRWERALIEQAGQEQGGISGHDGAKGGVDLVAQGGARSCLLEYLLLAMSHFGSVKSLVVSAS